MAIKMKHIALTGGFLLAIGFLSKAVRTGTNLQVEPEVKLKKLDFQHLTLALDAVVKNPTKGSLRFEFPFITLKVGGKLLASTDLLDLEVELGPFSQKSLGELAKAVLRKDFDLKIPLLSLAWLTPNLIELWSGDIPHLEMEVRVQTRAFVEGLPTAINIDQTEITLLSKPQL